MRLRILKFSPEENKSSEEAKVGLITTEGWKRHPPSTVEGGWKP